MVMNIHEVCGWPYPDPKWRAKGRNKVRVEHQPDKPATECRRACCWWWWCCCCWSWWWWFLVFYIIFFRHCRCPGPLRWQRENRPCRHLTSHPKTRCERISFAGKVPFFTPCLSIHPGKLTAFEPPNECFFGAPGWYVWYRVLYYQFIRFFLTSQYKDPVMSRHQDSNGFPQLPVGRSTTHRSQGFCVVTAAPCSLACEPSCFAGELRAWIPENFGCSVFAWICRGKTQFETWIFIQFCLVWAYLGSVSIKLMWHLHQVYSSHHIISHIPHLNKSPKTWERAFS